jgi:flagellin
MVISHNLTADNALRYNNMNTSKLSKSFEKLASGFKINRAGDNAAGLAVSEKMRAQLRGIEQAVNNAQDGISMVQTFEGALTETHNILRRIKTLAAQSANGTYDDQVDRAAIELEYEQLISELDDIAGTDFNGVKVLDGSARNDQKNASDIYRRFLNSYLKDAASVIKKTTGLEITDNLEIEVMFEDMKDGNTVAACSYTTNAVTAGKNYFVVSFNTEFIKPDDIISSGSGGVFGGMQLDQIITHELTHGLMGTTFDTKVDKPPLWYVEGLAEGAIGNNRFQLSFGETNTALNVINTYLRDFDPTTDLGDPTLGPYFTGYLFVSYMDNFGGTGRIKDFNNYLKANPTTDFDTAVQNVFGKTLSEINDQMQADLTSVISTADMIDFLDEKFNIQWGDGKYDALSNHDGTAEGIIPNGSGNKLVTPTVELQIDGKSVTVYFLSDGDDSVFGDAALEAGEYDVKGNFPGVSLQVGARTKDLKRYDFDYSGVWSGTGLQEKAIGDLNADINATAEGLGLVTDSVNLSTQTTANTAIDQIDFAINKISMVRGTFGAIQNRLEHKIDNLNSTNENLTAAESRIRDTDMAKQVSDMAKWQILQQASQAMIAQANMLPQSVMQFLQ